MGNQQSAEAPRRLTKPRTNTSTTNLLAGASGSRHNSTLELPVATKRASIIAIGDDTDSPAVVDAPAKSKAVDRPQRWSLFRSKSAAPDYAATIPDPAPEARDDDLANPLQRYSSVSSPQVDVLVDDSQNGRSSIRPPLRNTRGSISQHPRSQHVARLSLVVEAQTPEPALHDESRQLGFKVMPSDDVLPEDSTLTPIERSSSTHSLSTMGIPIRRRSLLTPGIATRSSSNDNIYRSSLNAQHFSTLTSTKSSEWTDAASDSRRSLPSYNSLSFDHLRQRYEDDSNFTSSPPEELPILQTPPIADCQPRVSTPCDLDYRHIGAFKLGTLRITNGSASPAPSVHDRIFWDSSPSKTNDGGSRQPQNESPSRMKESRHERGDDERQSARSDVCDDEPGPRQTKNKPPRLLDMAVEIPSFSLACDFGSSTTSAKQLEAETPKSAHELAQAYMQDIASSPFSFDETPLPSPLEATSKHTAAEDNLFDDESDNFFSHSPSPVGYISRQPSKSTADQPCAEELMKARNLHANHIGATQGPLEPAPKPLEKADSGYSSKTSVRSFSSKVSSIERENLREELRAPAVPSRGPPAPPVPTKSPPPPPPKTVYLRNSFGVTTESNTFQRGQPPLNTNFPSNTLATPAAPAAPPQMYALGYSSLASRADSTMPQQARMHSFDGLRLNPYNGGSPLPQRRPSAPTTRRSEPPPLPVKSIEENQAAARTGLSEAELRKSTSGWRQSVPNSVPFTSNSLSSKPSESDMSTTTTRRRLQKPRYALEPEVVVQGINEIDMGTIPPVSQDAADHLEERLRNFPTLSHTYKSVHKTSSKETLATILSAGSLEVRAEDRMTLSRLEGRPSMLSTESSNEDIEQFVSQALLHQTLAPAEAASVPPKITKSRRKSGGNVIQGHDFAAHPAAGESHLDGFEFVPESMGASSVQFPAMNPVGNGSHVSHSSWDSNGRNDSKSSSAHTIGMDSPVAAQFARERSRILRRHSSEEWVDSMDQHLALSVAQLQNGMAEDVPPVPNLSSEGDRERPRLQKMKSSPPVSMRTQLTQSTARPPRPAVAPPALPVDTTRHPSDVQWSETPIPNGSEWQNQTSRWREQRRELEFVQRPAERGSFKPPMPRNANSMSSVEQLRQRPQLTSRLSLEWQGQATSPPALAKPVRKLPPSTHQNPAFQNQRSAIARQLYDPLPPRRDGDLLHRSSVDSIAGPGWDSGSRPAPSMSKEAPPPVPIVVDRYSGGYGYGFERGLGVGGSAGLRHEAATASRKGVEGSLLWGVDFSDVPIIVMQRPRGVEA